MSRDSCRSRILEGLLDLVWSQWTTLGVLGSGSAAGGWIIDPEALVIFTCRMGRYDPRVFNAMIDWLMLHQRFINVGRLKALNSKGKLSDGNVLPAISHLLMKPSSHSKWRSLSSDIQRDDECQEPLFLFKNGYPHPDPGKPDQPFARAGFSMPEYRSRNVAKLFDPDHPANLILKLRALLGVNARCEIIAYLARHSGSNPTETAAATGYSQKAVHNVMNELHKSGTVYKRVKGRETLYSLQEKVWEPLLSVGEEVKWLDWRQVFSFLIEVWTILDDERFQGIGEGSLESELLLLLTRRVPRLPVFLGTRIDDMLRGRAEDRAGLSAICNQIMDLIQDLTLTPAKSIGS